MGLLSTPQIKDDDPRCQPDAYLTLNGHLYEVIEWKPSGASSGMLSVRNSRTGYLMRLGSREVLAAKLVRSAPVLPETVPEGWGSLPQPVPIESD